MKIKLHSKTGNITDAMQEMAEKEFVKLDKFVADEPAKINIETVGKKLTMKAQIVLKSNRHVRCEVSSTDYYKALKKAVANLVEQAKSTKEKISHKGRIEKTIIENEITDYPEVKKVKYFEVETVTEQMAITEMEKLGHETYVFKNLNEEGRICMIYKRLDGDYSMIVITN